MICFFSLHSKPSARKNTKEVRKFLSVMCNVQELLLYFKFTAAKVENKKQQQKKQRNPEKT